MFRTPVLVTATLAALAGLLVGWGREIERAREAGAGPQAAGGRVERCVSCHVAEREDPGGVHARAALGCASCHGGNPLAFGKERAHENLEREPGALSTLANTCGQRGCHPREAARVLSSPMTRASGIVAVDRWVFGETRSPDSPQTIQEVLAAARPTPAETHLRKLCAGCHLGTRRDNRDRAVVGNGSGCSACHAPRRSAGEPPRRHPPIDARVPDDRCLGCHSRSGRISTSYAGLAEIEPQQVHDAAGSPCATPASLHDGRPACRLAPDVHRAARMACVDCHVHSEVMGDGTARVHEEEQVEIACQSCHAPMTEHEETWAGVDDAVTRDLLRLRGAERPSEEPVRRGRRGTPLWNLRPSGSGWLLTTKVEGKAIPVKATPFDANHRMRGHERLSCGACHAAWAPTCATCHTRFDPSRPQWDFAAAAETPGAWLETSEGFAFAPPALGVRSDREIVPVIPGMILDVRHGGGDTPVLRRRLFAPIEPHTTGKPARTCSGCHRSPAALGLGSGRLDLEGNQPAFSPSSPSAEDPALASDGWTALFPERPAIGTRTGLRSLDSSEQRRILTAGVCLPCHAKPTDRIWRDFRASLTRLPQERRCPYSTRVARWLSPG